MKEVFIATLPQFFSMFRNPQFMLFGFEGVRSLILFLLKAKLQSISIPQIKQHQGWKWN